MDRRKKTYLAIVGLGLGALVIDRTLLRPDAEPDAAAAAQGQPAPSAARPEIKVAIPLHIEVPPFPRDLPHPSTHAQQRDPFAISSRIEAILTGRTDLLEGGPDQAEKSRPGREQLASQRRLSAVVRVHGEWVAIIDGLKLTEGQVLDECRLSKITANSALFDCWDGKALLSIERPSLEANSK
jgi:hypothetical protein